MEDKKVVIITGAAMGIGKAAVDRFGRAGWQIAAVDWNGEALAATEAEMTGKGYAVDAYVLNVADYDACAAMVADVEAKYGRIDGLYNNAGILGDRDGILGFDHETVKDAFEVNVFGSLNLIQLVARVMDRLGIQGAIVNTTSINAEVGTWDPIGYIGLKGAMKAITQGAAFHLGAQGIRVNAVSPGATITPMAASVYDVPPAREAVALNHNRHRWITPEEVANAAFWLISDEASGVNGIVVAVDDGYATGKGADLLGIFEEWESEHPQA